MPLEVITITEAAKRGEKVATLAKQFGVTRQTVYNAIQTIDEGRIKVPNEEQAQAQPPLAKRTRTKRIPPEICQHLIEWKQKYPSWGIQYLRKRWIEAGNTPMAKSTINTIYKEANLLTKKVARFGA